MGKSDATWPSFVNYPEKILTKLQTEHPQSESEKLNIIIGRWRAGGGERGGEGGIQGRGTRDTKGRERDVWW